ncbi:phosphoribosylformylglycinamidine cyclo-ligase [Candidatus Bathyarchaeota archaeon]|nr:phosphoribosylformylglycinamidine cyclo-ligase [Candidatus Bathyarchaeota archaeon]
MSWSYSRAGVDQEKIRRLHSEIEELVTKTYRFRTGKFAEVIMGFGHYASLIDVGGGRALALHSDGCGTKALVAQMMNRFSTIGIDCVAMCVNDLICVGAKPTTLIDYLALEKPDETVTAEIMRGLVEAAEESEISIVGGETAIMPDVIRGAVPGRGFDLAAFCLGEVEMDRIVRGDRIKPGDVIVGLESSGIHSNGLSLARKVLLEEKGFELDEKPPGLCKTVGETLLEPTRIYVKPVIEAMESSEIHGVAHITGGAFTKLRRFERYARVGFHLDEMPRPSPVFELIQEAGKIPDDEMYRTFNMGVGMCIMTSEGSVGEVLSCMQHFNLKADVVGRVTDEPGVRVNTKGKTLRL